MSVRRQIRVDKLLETHIILSRQNDIDGRQTLPSAVISQPPLFQPVQGSALGGALISLARDL
jgi:hypothetical protein